MEIPLAPQLESSVICVAPAHANPVQNAVCTIDKAPRLAPDSVIVPVCMPSLSVITLPETVTEVIGWGPVHRPVHDAVKLPTALAP